MILCAAPRRQLSTSESSPLHYRHCYRVPKLAMHHLGRSQGPTQALSHGAECSQSRPRCESTLNVVHPCTDLPGVRLGSGNHFCRVRLCRKTRPLLVGELGRTFNVYIIDVPKSSADVSNTAVRIFLHEIGKWHQTFRSRRCFCNFRMVASISLLRISLADTGTGSLAP